MNLMYITSSIVLTINNRDDLVIWLHWCILCIHCSNVPIMD